MVHRTKRGGAAGLFCPVDAYIHLPERRTVEESVGSRARSRVLSERAPPMFLPEFGPVIDYRLSNDRNDRVDRNDRNATGKAGDP